MTENYSGHGGYVFPADADLMLYPCSGQGYYVMEDGKKVAQECTHNNWVLGDPLTTPGGLPTDLFKNPFILLGVGLIMVNYLKKRR